MAPMSGITDLPFRLISREFGATQCFFEMLHSNSVIYRHPKNKRLLNTLKKDRPVAAQLLGAEPFVMLEAAQRLADLLDIAFIDINSACPAKKVIKKGEGAALLENKTRLGKIIKMLSSNLRLPVTVKLRTGFRRKDTRACVRIAQSCQENGAAVIFIHGRTCSQGYSGDVDYASIRAVKKALKIPVFGSGNIFNPALAKKMLDETSCDGILVARGALGNPWIFKAIRKYLRDGKIPEGQDLSEKIKVLRRHLAYINRYNNMPPDHKLGIMGRVAGWYLKGFPDAAKTRKAVFEAGSYEELLNLIANL